MAFDMATFMAVPEKDPDEQSVHSVGSTSSLSRMPLLKEFEDDVELEIISRGSKKRLVGALVITEKRAPNQELTIELFLDTLRTKLDEIVDSEGFAFDPSIIPNQPNMHKVVTIRDCLLLIAKILSAEFASRQLPVHFIQTSEGGMAQSVIVESAKLKHITESRNEDVTLEGSSEPHDSQVVGTCQYLAHKLCKKSGSNEEEDSELDTDGHSGVTLRWAGLRFSFKERYHLTVLLFAIIMLFGIYTILVGKASFQLKDEAEMGLQAVASNIDGVGEELVATSYQYFHNALRGLQFSVRDAFANVTGSLSRQVIPASSHVLLKGLAVEMETRVTDSFVRGNEKLYEEVYTLSTAASAIGNLVALQRIVTNWTVGQPGSTTVSWINSLSNPTVPSLLVVPTAAPSTLPSMCTDDSQYTMNKCHLINGVSFCKMSIYLHAQKAGGEHIVLCVRRMWLNHSIHESLEATMNLSASFTADNRPGDCKVLLGLLIDHDGIPYDFGPRNISLYPFFQQVLSNISKSPRMGREMWSTFVESVAFGQFGVHLLKRSIRGNVILWAYFTNMSCIQARIRDRILSWGAAIESNDLRVVFSDINAEGNLMAYFNKSAQRVDPQQYLPYSLAARGWDGVKESSSLSGERVIAGYVFLPEVHVGLTLEVSTNMWKSVFRRMFCKYLRGVARGTKANTRIQLWTARMNSKGEVAAFCRDFPPHQLSKYALQFRKSGNLRLYENDEHIHAFYKYSEPLRFAYVLTGQSYGVKSQSALALGYGFLTILVVLVVGAVIQFFVSRQTLDTIHKKYSEHSEGMQEDRRHFYNLLQDMVPAHLFSRIENGERLVVENYQRLTFVFCDHCGTSNLYLQMKNYRSVFRYLGYLMMMTDGLANYYSIFKVQMIGDAFFGVNGMPEGPDTTKEQDDTSQVLQVYRTVSFACVLQQLCSSQYLHYPERTRVFAEYSSDMAEDVIYDIPVSIGIHTGPAAVGFMGLSMSPNFDCYSPAVSLAARLQDTCPAYRIQLSGITRQLLVEVDVDRLFEFDPSQKKLLHGFGTMTTYTLKSTKMVVPDDVTEWLQVEPRLIRKFVSKAEQDQSTVEESELAPPSQEESEDLEDELDGGPQHSNVFLPPLPPPQESQLSGSVKDTQSVESRESPTNPSGQSYLVDLSAPPSMPVPPVEDFATYQFPSGEEMKSKSGSYS